MSKDSLANGKLVIIHNEDQRRSIDEKRTSRSYPLQLSQLNTGRSNNIEAPVASKDELLVRCRESIQELQSIIYQETYYTIAH